jgi:radical S-adenosyl methionine domain-containing protein 2
MAAAPVIPRSVNYFISRVCNYSCKFCFHTAKNDRILPLARAQEGLRLLKEAGCEKMNFAGGEPFMQPKFLGELCRTSAEMGMAVSIISNGSLVSPRWMDEYARYVDILGVSVDSFVPTTNAAIGRGGDAHNRHAQRMMRVRDMWLNFEEDMNDQIAALDPYRWKAFQVLLLEGENTGGKSLRDARALVISRSEFDAFCARHAERPQLIPEPNDVMQNSYLLLDEALSFLNCAGGGKTPSRSILDVGVDAALTEAGFDEGKFEERGGVFEWRRPRAQAGAAELEGAAILSALVAGRGQIPTQTSL